jgi:hypothetical protein
METQSSAAQKTNINQQSCPRASGKVNVLPRRLSKPRLPEAAPLSFNDVLCLYKNLLALRDQDDSELTKAIAYGLKLLGDTKNPRKKKSQLPTSSLLN